MQGCELDEKARRRFFTNPFDDWRGEKNDEGSSSPPKKKSKSSQRISQSWLSRLDAYKIKLLHFIQTDYPPDTIKGYSVYTGAAGVAYMYLMLHESQGTNKYLEEAEKYITRALHNLRVRPSRSSVMSFICGKAGVYAVAAVVYHRLNDPDMSRKYVERLVAISESFMPISKHFEEWEHLYGCSGYMYALNYVSHHIGQNFDETLSNLLAHAVQNGKRISKIVGKELGEKEEDWPELMYRWHKRPYFAMAHGICGVLQQLLVRWDLVSQRDQDSVKSTIDWLLTKKFPSGNYPTRWGGTNDILVQWCHGATAVGLLLVKAYQVLKCEKYLTAAKEASDVVWERGLLKKGLGLCHGISGNAYLFFYLYTITNEEKYLYRLQKFIDFSHADNYERLIKTPDEPYSLLNGVGGAVCLYEDLLTDQTHCCFPACDISLSSN
eukprot:CAMPEP_0174251796 /NCGR_PEP_ID=MMETSP0439-20130205/1507_1 /TAXON_ID=0 /ORGANISM="Stereomyxa ramosa, Strain Chinc5" /LENGTH=436 /DNA_ID=CAMNT_0015332211 /DNA_START=53 /DNA_END=1363 /DNA_ORIENTATION=-